MKKFENFCKAVKNLEEGAEKEDYSTLEETGLVAMFEICYEQTWKVLKAVLKKEGYREAKTGSPRQIFKTAYSAGILPEEEVWLEILEDRNILSHVYDADKAKVTVEKIKQKYLPAFQNLKKILETDFNSAAEVKNFEN